MLISCVVLFCVSEMKDFDLKCRVNVLFSKVLILLCLLNSTINHRKEVIGCGRLCFG